YVVFSSVACILFLLSNLSNIAGPAQLNSALDSRQPVGTSISSKPSEQYQDLRREEILRQSW
ncbi:MAG: hypothetical protein MK080_08265, partial [Opitutales bacterium]|nr:hypothetical protein [Opitutales bacterium]